MRSLAQTLRRYTGLNHLAQAARAVLQNSSQVNQMLSDLNKVDFANVQDQVRDFLYSVKIEMLTCLPFLLRLVGFAYNVIQVW